MRKIINNKSYDTKTAEQLGSWDNGHIHGDFNFCEETLYRKRNGEFFLLGEGGANTRYAQRCELNGWAGGWEIMPMTYQAAQQWAEKRLTAQKYESIFGEIPEDDGREIITFSLSAATVEKIKREASKRGISKSAVIDELFKNIK